MKPRMFVGSSVEQLDLAYAAQEGLEHDVEVTVWAQGVFNLSRTAIASLIDLLDDIDFGLFILAPDDVTAMREANVKTIRDNVIFELGLFVGRLGSDRCFLIIPQGIDDLHLPSDLIGITPATYEPNRQDANMVAALGPACNRVRKAIRRLGQFSPTSTSLSTGPHAIDLPDGTVETFSDPDDCLLLIRSWMGSRDIHANRRALRYTDVDKELKLKPGSARLYIEKAACRWYVVDSKGKETILFKEIPDRI